MTRRCACSATCDRRVIDISGKRRLHPACKARLRYVRWSDREVSYVSRVKR